MAAVTDTKRGANRDQLWPAYMWPQGSGGGLSLLFTGWQTIIYHVPISYILPLEARLAISSVGHCAIIVKSNGMEHPVDALPSVARHREAREEQHDAPAHKQKKRKCERSVRGWVGVRAWRRRDERR